MPTKEQKRNYQRKYVETHADYHREYKTLWSRNNPEKVKAQRERYKANHPKEPKPKKVRTDEDILQSKERKRLYQKENSKIWNKRTRLKFIEMYGGKCNCCGETTVEFLTVEHVNGQRGIEKKESGNVAYQRAIKKYNPKVYEILCWNCNCSKGTYGQCPHKRVK